jgi:cation diffusion facilitator CzcD-associated flavoprotein CzcO
MAVTAHLRGRGIETVTVGKPMEFWKNMPPSMHLKSTYSSITISDPVRAFTQQRYAEYKNWRVEEPVPLDFLLGYADWFRENNTPDIIEQYARHVTYDSAGYHVTLEDGQEIAASQVVIATGVAPFAVFPQYTRDLSADLVSHVQEHRDFAAWSGKRVAVIGSGESALESAALLHEAGAEVEVIARGPIIWIDRRLANERTRRLFYPSSDVGPAGVAWLVHFPGVFRMLPEQARIRIDERCVRPSGAQWIRSRVDGVVRLTPHTEVTTAAERGGGLHLTLSDGATRELDHLFLGTGYAPDVNKLTFLDQSLRRRVATSDGYTVLNEWFESSVPGLYFTGAIAGYNFGPICRFIAGTGATARQIARRVTTRASVGSVRPLPLSSEATPAM